MPWTTRNYPVSWKNFDPLLRKKAIDIGNAMMAEGYDEVRAIPIATKQAEEWFKKASKDDLKKLEYKNVTTKTRKKGPSGARLMDDNVIVSWDMKTKDWIVKSEEAINADSHHKTKGEATKRAKEIAAKRGTKVITKTKSES